MRKGGITPTGVERTFPDTELIVSKTDSAGRLTYVNKLFLEVSRFSEAEMLGKPHSIVRHPEMPRCVFALLWSTIQSGQEIFAYVNNLAADGANYWVLAHVTPSYDDRGKLVGYHSNRRTPHRAALSRVQPLYAQLLGEERKHSRPADAVAGSSALLERVVAEQAATYDQFVWSLEPAAVGR